MLNRTASPLQIDNVYFGGSDFNSLNENPVYVSAVKSPEPVERSQKTVPNQKASIINTSELTQDSATSSIKNRNISMDIPNVAYIRRFETMSENENELLREKTNRIVLSLQNGGNNFGDIESDNYAYRQNTSFEQTKNNFGYFDNLSSSHLDVNISNTEKTESTQEKEVSEVDVIPTVYIPQRSVTVQLNKPQVDSPATLKRNTISRLFRLRAKRTDSSKQSTISNSSSQSSLQLQSIPTEIEKEAKPEEEEIIASNETLNEDTNIIPVVIPRSSTYSVNLDENPEFLSSTTLNESTTCLTNPEKDVWQLDLEKLLPQNSLGQSDSTTKKIIPGIRIDELYEKVFNSPRIPIESTESTVTKQKEECPYSPIIMAARNTNWTVNELYESPFINDEDCETYKEIIGKRRLCYFECVARLVKDLFGDTETDFFDETLSDYPDLEMYDINITSK
ncbi:hypothetical protein HK098_007735 [Nowakowskiella sp. JEL0407]|nr:hypothetical protein HK098_007735 [Nowakowskiella sp. JEL0407]